MLQIQAAPSFHAKHPLPQIGWWRIWRFLKWQMKSSAGFFCGSSRSLCLLNSFGHIWRSNSTAPLPQIDGWLQHEYDGVRPNLSGCIIASALVLVSMSPLLLRHACHHRHPALNKMSIFILWAELVLLHVLHSIPKHLFLVQSDKNEMGKTLCQEHESSVVKMEGSSVERRRVGGLGCHGSLTLCGGHHYDNKHSSTFHGRPSL